MELESPHLAAVILITVSGKSHSRMLKISGWNCEWEDIERVSKNLPTWSLLKTNGKHSNFAVGKPCRHPTWEIKVNITSCGTNWWAYLLKWCSVKHTTASTCPCQACLPQIRISRKWQICPNWGTVYTIMVCTRPKYQCRETRQRKPKRLQLNATHHLGFSSADKGHHWDNWENLIKICRSDNCIAWVWISWFW